MKSWMVLHGSSGHTEWHRIEEVHWQLWTNLGFRWRMDHYQGPPPRKVPFHRIGRYNRAVYIYPDDRQLPCFACMDRELAEAGHA